MDQSIIRTDLVERGPSVQLSPWWLIRCGRGRVGGSTFLNFVIEWGRHQGRRVKPLDGDLRSRTLTSLYPRVRGDGVKDADAAVSPPSEELIDNKAWFTAELDASVEDGVCRAVDFGGGDRVIQEYGADLRIGDFCASVGLPLVWAFVLGPDEEDLRHVTQILKSGQVTGGHVLLVLNEGVIRPGQKTVGVFDAVSRQRDYLQLLEDGAESFIMPRLTCLDQLREKGLGFYDAASGHADRDGRRASPTTQHMTSTWLKDMEAQLEASGASKWRA